MSDVLEALGVPQSHSQFKTDWKTRWATCNTHGFEYLEVWLPSLELWTAAKGCEACARERETGQRQPRRGQTVEELRLEQAGIPERFRGRTLKDFALKEFKQALDVAKSFATGDNLLIVGQLGTGKTSYACALLSQPWALELANGPQYLACLTAMESLWSAANPRVIEDGAGSRLPEVLASFNEPGLLVLDDVQDCRTAEEVSWLQRIVATRYALKRSTVLIGSPDLETLEGVLGSRMLNELRGRVLKFGE